MCAQTLVNWIESGECEYDYVEVMACPSGCTNGGGQIASLPIAAVNRLYAQWIHHGGGISVGSQATDAEAGHVWRVLHQGGGEDKRGAGGGACARLHTTFRARQLSAEAQLEEW